MLHNQWFIFRFTKMDITLKKNYIPELQPTQYRDSSFL